MTKAESYLYDRLDMLSDEKVILITKINIEEINTKIEELSKDVDDAFDFFSPRAKKNDFIRDEIESLNVKKQELSKLIEDLNKQSVLVDEDIFIIKDALGENDLTEEEIEKAKDAIEKSHEERYLALLNNVEMQKVFEKSEEVMWECRNCGHLVIGKKAPMVCPVCAHPQSFFEVRKENY